MKVGAARIILPEVEMGVQVANMLANPTVHELMALDNRYNIIEFPANERWVGKTIVEIDFRNNFKTNIIAIRPTNSLDYTIEFKPSYVVTEDDVFIGVTTDVGQKKLLNA